MTLEKFEDFWKLWTEQWLESEIEIDEVKIKPSSLCSIKRDIAKEVWNNYNIIKRIVKDKYFAEKDKSKIRLDKYKRAAVIVYAINSSSPLKYKRSKTENRKVDGSLLKQRLAFYIAWASIVMEYDKTDVESLGEPVCINFPIRTDYENEMGADSFELGLYKGLFYAQLYNAYDVMSMANVFWLLVENASNLSKLETIDNKHTRGPD